MTEMDTAFIYPFFLGFTLGILLGIFGTLLGFKRHGARARWGFKRYMGADGR